MAFKQLYLLNVILGRVPGQGILFNEHALAFDGPKSTTSYFRYSWKNTCQNRGKVFFSLLSWLLLHGRLNTRDMLIRKRKKKTILPMSYCSQVTEKHHTISSLIENLQNSIGTGYICKGTEKFLKQVAMLYERYSLMWCYGKGLSKKIML
jgi:hypothetical protein